MSTLRVAFWNLQNLFDTTASEIATDLEFTPQEGWTEEVAEAKIQNLAAVLRLLHGGAGPDLLGLWEIENVRLAERLIAATGRADLRVVHLDSPDLRGIDCCLLYSANVFKAPPKAAIRNHVLHLRYPTRDIFEVELELRDSAAKLLVLVNHWPSRSRGRLESEPLRIAVAERCGRVVDEYLKFTKDEFLALPATAATRAALLAKWNRNVLLMGDFNDEPFDRSVLDSLLATRDLDRIEEDLPIPARAHKPPASGYLARHAYLFNCMWPFVGRADTGTYFHGGSMSESAPTNTMNTLDQFMASRGLLFGKQGLKIDATSVAVFRAPPIAAGAKQRPKPFDIRTRKGYSDHFPIECTLEVL